MSSKTFAAGRADVRADGDQLAGMAERLGAWFDGNARDLPWRRRRDGYSVWVSEIMLQQTRVQTVLAYYPRFVRAYPTVGALARAPLDEVLAAWSGLGYYRRARALHEGARMVVREHEGALPEDAGRLREIPGIGRYTAGAIASLAFGLREPLVDGNVARVLARIFAIEEDVRSPQGQKRLWELAETFLPAGHPGRHNEALMELGALVCTVGEPDCAACPLRDTCQAHRLGLQSALPRVGRRKPAKAVELVALLARRGDCVLLARRSADGLFGRMWEPPMIAVTEMASRGEAHGKAIAELLGGAHEEPVTALGTVTHVLTHRKLTIAVVATVVPARGLCVPAPYECVEWVPLPSMGGLALSTLARKVLAMQPPAACAKGAESAACAKGAKAKRGSTRRHAARAR